MSISQYSKPLLLVLLLAMLLADMGKSEPEPNNHNHRSAFGFIQHLKGCHKGQKNTTDLHHLKRYLEKFGYLDYAHNNNDHANDDDFDDVLESAVKSYQQYFHLNVTGTLDEETVKQMAMPRCGFPDKTNESGNHHHRHSHNRKLIHGVSHYSFFRGAPRWPASMSRLTYRFTAPVSAGVSAACARAFKRWEQASHFRFQEVSSGSASHITIGFHRGNHGDGAPFDGPGGTLAHAFAPTRGMFHYDADETWSLNPGLNQVDLESVAVHEIGHLLGLGHEPNVPDAIMYPTFSYGRIKRDLHADDIRGIRDLYDLGN